jgi:ABC-type transport system involved in Fe-S cluster assembly fused permease/ATPase subunit
LHSSEKEKSRREPWHVYPALPTVLCFCSYICPCVSVQGWRVNWRVRTQESITTANERKKSDCLCGSVRVQVREWSI